MCQRYVRRKAPYRGLTFAVDTAVTVTLTVAVEVEVETAIGRQEHAEEMIEFEIEARADGALVFEPA